MKCCFINCTKDATEQVETYWNQEGECVCKKHKNSILKNVAAKGKRSLVKYMAIDSQSIV